jgi:class 3 adenylate cyclase
MATPRIHYARTDKGVSIAYCIEGHGPDLLFVSPPPFCHVKLDWDSFFALIFPPLASNNRLLWFDWPGSGLSDRDSFDFSMEALTRDIGTVVARAGFEKFAVASLLGGVAITLTYAAKSPDKVTHLILADGWTQPSELDQSPTWQAERALRGADWVIYSETFARVLMGYEDDDYAHELARYMRACVEPEAHRAAFDALEHFDVSALLPEIKAPTLVVHNQKSPWVGIQSGRRLASEITDSRFVPIDDLTYAHLPALVDEFIREDEAPRSSARPEALEAPHGTAVILFADIADSTALTERLGDAAFRAKARDLDSALRTTIRDHSGTPIEGKLLGDGVLAVFTSARQAIEAALACAKSGDDAGLPLHLGLHAGDVIREDNNVYGGAVNIASRISGLSAPGEVLVSDTVRSLARTSAGVSFEDRGEQTLKGVSEPVRLWVVHEQGVGNGEHA